MSDLMLPFPTGEFDQTPDDEFIHRLICVDRFKRRIYKLNLSAIEHEEAVKRMTGYLERYGRRYELCDY